MVLGLTHSDSSIGKSATRSRSSSQYALSRTPLLQSEDIADVPPKMINVIAVIKKITIRFILISKIE